MINLDCLEKFLIKESKINKDFIKDFFCIQKNKVYENTNRSLLIWMILHIGWKPKNLTLRRV